MAERVRDGGGTTTEQAEQAERTDLDESPPQEPERRPTYKTLDEQRGRLTEAEERFERGRRTVGLFLGPLAFLVLLALPFDLEGKQQALAAIPGLVVVWWITEAIPIPITGIIGLCRCVILNVASADEVFGSVADSTIFLLIMFIALLVVILFLNRPEVQRVEGAGASSPSTGTRRRGSTGAASCSSAPASPWAP
jgi:hypothetical protein